MFSCQTQENIFIQSLIQVNHFHARKRFQNLIQANVFMQTQVNVFYSTFNSGKSFSCQKTYSKFNSGKRFHANSGSNSGKSFSFFQVSEAQARHFLFKIKFRQFVFPFQASAFFIQEQMEAICFPSFRHLKPR